MQDSGNRKRYGKFSYIYDWTGDYPYHQVRQNAIDKLQLQEGDVVVDLFCGTGINFGYILDHIGDTGEIIGVDGSAGMLQRAEQRVKKKNWDTKRIQLLEQDLRYIDEDFFSTTLPESHTSKVLITLGLSAISNWADVFDRLYLAAAAGTRFSIMDIYCEKPTLSAKVINYIGSSDCARKVWEPLEAKSLDYQEEWYCPFRVLKVSVIVASGVKRE